MTRSRWREVREIAADALELPVRERDDFILRTCGYDTALKEEVERLVAASDPALTGPLDRPFPALLREEPSLPEDMLLSGRFRIGTLLARGGMGEVYRARDERMREDVALKIISREIADRPGIVDRFRREVQRARRITHPNVCRIHDLYFHNGPDGSDLQFLTMQLINGPTLSRCIEQRENNPVLESLPLLLDVIAGLAAAHEAGIAHCDLKPSNILLDRPEGHRARAIITDFGLARALRDEKRPDTTRTDIVGGAPAYMPPELRFGGGGGVQGDIYAFGVIAYELLTGAHPFDRKPLWEAGAGWHVKAPRLLAAEIPLAWETAILRCLEPEPDARFGSVIELQSAVADHADNRNVGQDGKLDHSSSSPPENMIPGTPGLPAGILVPVSRSKASEPSGVLRGSPLRRLTATVIALVIGVAGCVTTFRWLHSHALSGNSARHMLVAEIDNQTGQALLDHTVGELVTAMLEQSPVVKVFPSSQLPEALRLMGKPESSELGIPLALEICQREGLEGIVAGSVTRVGSEYLIILRALDPHGETITSASTRASSLDQVIRAAEEASGALRTSLGESIASIRKSTPLERVTSPSLQAVQYYSLGKIQLNSGDPEGAASLFRRAIQTDAQFAMAHAYLGNTFEQLGDMMAAQKDLSIAVQLSGRVSEPEKLKILGDYYLALKDFGEAVKYYELLIRTRPAMASAHLNLGQAYFGLHNFDRAITETDAAFQIDPQKGFAINAVEILLSAGRCQDAMARAQNIRDPSDSRLNYIMGRCYLAAGEVERAGNLFDKMCLSPGTKQAAGCAALADISLARRRIDRAHAELEQALHAEQNNQNEYGVTFRMLEIASLEAAQKRKPPSDAIHFAEIENDDRLLILALELFGLTGDSGRLREIIADLDRQRSAHETSRARFLSAIARSTLALVENKANAAVDWARVAGQYDNSIFAIDRLAQAYAAAGIYAEAIRQFETVISRSNERMESYDEPAYHRLREVHEALAALYQRLGDHARAQAQLAAAARFIN